MRPKKRRRTPKKQFGSPSKASAVEVTDDEVASDVETIEALDDSARGEPEKLDTAVVEINGKDNI